MYQNDIFLPLVGIAKKPMSLTAKARKVLNEKALGTIQLCLTVLVAFNITDQKTTKDLMKALSILYAKMLAGGSVATHLNKFNSITS